MIFEEKAEEVNRIRAKTAKTSICKGRKRNVPLNYHSQLDSVVPVHIPTLLPIRKIVPIGKELNTSIESGDVKLDSLARNSVVRISTTDII